MVVETHFEQTIPGHVVKINGIDAAGNKLGNDVEFFIRTGEEEGRGKLHLVEAFAALLRMVDDFRIVEQAPEHEFVDKWRIKNQVESDLANIKEMAGIIPMTATEGKNSEGI